jgi:hypothetical protein
MSNIGLGTSLALLGGFLGYVLCASCACLPCPLLQSSDLLLETFASVHLFWGGGIPLLSSFGSPLIISRWLLCPEAPEQAHSHLVRLYCVV